MDIFDIDTDLYSNASNDNQYDAANSHLKMSDEVVKTIMEAIKEDDDSKFQLLSANMWDIVFEDATSQMVFKLSLKTILENTSPDEQIMTFLREKIWSYTKIFPEESVILDILRNTLYSKRRVNENTLLRDIPLHDLKDMVKDVMTASNLDHPWYKTWHFCRDITGIYNPFDPKLYPNYFEANDSKDMLAVVMGICNMEPSAASVCEQDFSSRGYQITFFSLSELVDRKFIIKASRRFDKFIMYDGSTIMLRALTLYDIQVLKYLIKHFDNDAARTIYQLLASMMMSEKDVRLAEDIGWFSDISLDVFVEARQKAYLLPDTKCEADAFLAMKGITKDYNNVAKSFMRDFKFQASTSPANIWIAVTSLVFALVSVIQFFMDLGA